MFQTILKSIFEILGTVCGAVVSVVMYLGVIVLGLLSIIVGIPVLVAVGLIGFVVKVLTKWSEGPEDSR